MKESCLSKNMKTRMTTSKSSEVFEKKNRKLKNEREYKKEKIFFLFFYMLFFLLRKDEI